MFSNIRKSLSRLLPTSTSTPIPALQTIAADVRRLTQDLVPLERARRLEQRERYQRFAERQMRVEVESEADHERDLH